MRFLTLLLNNPPQKENVKYSDKERYTIYDKNLYRKYLLMTEMYKTDENIRSLYRKMVVLSHPFEILKTTITSNFIPNCQPLKITNAFMKMWEFLKWIDKNNYLKFDDNKTLSMYDVAGAPGMFILATEQYLNKYHNDISLDWHTCSLEGGTALTDIYGLFKNNRSRYTPCDVLNEKDIKKCINIKRRFKLVTGDIGIYHEDDYNTLQEEVQLDLEWGQMVLSLNLVDEGGVMFLKMYSMITIETLYLLDTLTKYFKNVYITKPYGTRIFNDESYIICIERNKKDCSKEPYKRPYLADYKSANQDLVKSFEYSRLDIKYRMVNFIKNVLMFNDRISIEYFKEKNNVYNIFFEEIEDLFNELNNLNKT